MDSKTADSRPEADLDIFRKRTDRYSIDSLTSPIVTIRVGIKTGFSAHKNILMKTKYFAACLADGKFEEEVSNTINLPDEDPDLFMVVLRYLYTGKVTEKDERVYNMNRSEEYPYTRFHAYSSKDIPFLIKLFIVADRYLMHDMCVSIEFIISSGIEYPVVNWSHLSQLKAAGLKGCFLWNTLMRTIIRRMRKQPRETWSQLLNDGLRSDPESTMELLEEFASEKNTVQHPA